MNDDLPAPTGLIELSMCSCKSNCSNDRCTCRRNKLVCTEMCRCCNACEKFEHDETELTDDSEDEDNFDFDELI